MVRYLHFITKTVYICFRINYLSSSLLSWSVILETMRKNGDDLGLSIIYTIFILIKTFQLPQWWEDKNPLIPGQILLLKIIALFIRQVI